MKIILYKVRYIHNKRLETIVYSSVEALSDFILMLTKCGGTLININRVVKYV